MPGLIHPDAKKRAMWNHLPTRVAIIVIVVACVVALAALAFSGSWWAAVPAVVLLLMFAWYRGLGVNRR